MKSFTVSVLLAVLAASDVHAFVPQKPLAVTLMSTGESSNLRTGGPSFVSTFSSEQNDVREQSFRLSLDEINPVFSFGQDEKLKVVNGFGLWCAVVSLTLAPVWMAAMKVIKMLHNMDENFDTERALYDRTGKIWAKAWLTLTNSRPTYSGEIETLREGHGPCLYVANHASWLDIPILCTVLDPVFKFIAKGELTKVPCIGDQLAGGDHILIDREDRRSQLRTFKEGIAWLKKGVPIMAFPEGMRSKDGVLMDFKGGLFAMAIKTGVPIVPISISHAHAVMPGVSFFPVQPGNGKLHLHVHSRILTEGKTDEELQALVRQAFEEQLPFDQLPKLEDAAETSQIETKERELVGAN